MSRSRWLAVSAVLLALFFAVEGGEYSTQDWLTLRREEREERSAIAELKVTLDSLARVTSALEKDPRAQERAAREAYGMIRKGEFLYRLVPVEGEP